MGFLDTVKKLVGQNTGAVDSAIDKVGDLVDEKTGDKYKGIVDQAQGLAKKEVDSTAPQTPPPAAPPTS
jgi:hypothetical protein